MRYNNGVENDNVVNVAEAADLLGRSRALTRRLCQQGRIPAEKIGRDWVLKLADIRQFAAEERKPGRPAAEAA